VEEDRALVQGMGRDLIEAQGESLVDPSADDLSVDHDQNADQCDVVEQAVQLKASNRFLKSTS